MASTGLDSRTGLRWPTTHYPSLRFPFGDYSAGRPPAQRADNRVLWETRAWRQGLVGRSPRSQRELSWDETVRRVCPSRSTLQLSPAPIRPARRTHGSGCAHTAVRPAAYQTLVANPIPRLLVFERAHRVHSSCPPRRQICRYVTDNQHPSNRACVGRHMPGCNVEQEHAQ